MLRLKWFLLGIIIAMFGSDWARLRFEKKRLLIDTERSIEVAEKEDKNVKDCLASLQSSKELLDVTQIVTLARIQTAELITKAQYGDPNAKQDLTAKGVLKKSKKNHIVTTSLEE